MAVSSTIDFEAIEGSISWKYFKKSSLVNPGPAITKEASSGTACLSCYVIHSLDLYPAFRMTGECESRSRFHNDVQNQYLHLLLQLQQ